ncbi:acyltransferase family protein [Arthrobacter sp. G.S.26]|uniref:acyltransferase family protein n=1 Tax=Arthrobacter sp. G.S.26 TaxID=3433706 RepID=UPI003D77379A
MSHSTVKEKTHSLTSGHRFAHVDAMRAFAVLLVVLAHAGLGDLIPGGSGVTIFFAISGFIITTLLLKEKAKSGGFDLKGFYTRRLLKIFPPFLVVVAIPTAIFAFFQEVRWDFFASQAFFYFNWIYMTNGDAGLLPGSGVVWSLSIEEQFYIGFALVWIATIQSKYYIQILTGLAILGSILPLLIRIFISFVDFSHARIYYGTDTRLDAIAIGILAAIVYYKFGNPLDKGTLSVKIKSSLGRDATLIIALSLYFGSLVVRDEVFRETLRYSMQAVAAALVILYGLLRPQRVTVLSKSFYLLANLRLVQIIGLASYSIYLVHLQITTLTETLLPDNMGPLLVAVNSVLGVLAGCLIWWIIEKPAERLKKRLFPSPKAMTQ